MQHLLDRATLLRAAVGFLLCSLWIESCQARWSDLIQHLETLNSQTLVCSDRFDIVEDATPFVFNLGLNEYAEMSNPDKAELDVYMPWSEQVKKPVERDFSESLTPSKDKPLYLLAADLYLYGEMPSKAYQEWLAECSGSQKFEGVDLGTINIEELRTLSEEAGKCALNLEEQNGKPHTEMSVANFQEWVKNCSESQNVHELKLETNTPSFTALAATLSTFSDKAKQCAYNIEQSKLLDWMTLEEATSFKKVVTEENDARRDFFGAYQVWVNDCANNWSFKPVEYNRSLFVSQLHRQVIRAEQCADNVKILESLKLSSEDASAFDLMVKNGNDAKLRSAKRYQAWVIRCAGDWSYEPMDAPQMLKKLAPMPTVGLSLRQQKSAALGCQTGKIHALLCTNNLVERLVRGLDIPVGMFFVKNVVAMRVQRGEDFYNYPLDVKNSSVSVDKEGTLSAVLARSFCVEDLDSDDPVSTHVTIRDDNVDIKIMTAVDVPGPP
eukprot:GHVS01015929.1.p1 GENE.GHVS01015929.1~~GHVS01015929.1.p1  ORF type:complete len:496 (+),score=42.07 GHVS01015929.1:88-1575(+)